MALETQIIQIPLAKGVDTKTDEKLVSAPFFADLRNATSAKTGRVAKRNGYDILGSNVIGSTALTNAEATGTFQNELMLFNGVGSYSRAEQFDKYQTRGRVSPVEVTARSIYQSGLSVTTADFAISQNISVYAFIDTNNDCYAVVTDELTGAVLGSPTKLNSSSTQTCRVVDLGDYIYVFFYGSTNVSYRRVALSDPSTFEAETAIGSATFTGTSSLDVVKLGSNRAAFAFNNNGGGISYGILISAPTPSISIDTSTLVEVSNTPITLVVDPTTLNIWMCYYRNTDFVRVFVFSNTLSTVLAATNVTSAAYPAVSAIAAEFVSGAASPTLQLYYLAYTTSRNFTNAEVNTGSDTITINNHLFANGQKVDFITSGALPTGLAINTTYYVIVVDANTIKLATSRDNALFGVAIDLTAAGAGTSTCRTQEEVQWRTELRSRSITQTGSLGTQTTIARGVDLRSKAFKTSDGVHYFLVGLVRASQFNYYLMDGSGNIISLCQPDNAIDSTYAIQNSLGTGSNIIQKFINIQDSQWTLPCIVKTSLLDPELVGSLTLYRNGIVRSTFDFGSFNKYFSEELSKNLIISGGYNSVYDGTFTTEANFFEYPEAVFVGQSNAGGTVAAGTYQIACTYEYQDAQGNVHISTPSYAGSVTTAGATSSIKVQVPNLHLTNRTSSAFPVRITVYCTSAGGSLYYKTKTSVSVKANDAQIITITAPISSSNPTLYTDSGEVENVIPPPSKLVIRNKNRALLVRSEDQKEILFSKYSFGNNPINFNSDFSKRLDGFGDVVGASALDDKFVLFTKNTVHYFSGDGPNDTGEQDTFTDIQLVTTDAGLKDINSIAQMPLGIMFKSQKGVYLLDRALNLKYVGAPVEDYNGNEITSAVLLEQKNQVVFTSVDGNPALVYDYYQDNWQIWDNHDAIDALTLNGTYHWLKSGSASVYQQGDGFKDGSVTYPLKIETPWIKLASIQGFQRIRKMAVLGDFKSNHKLKVSISYDYQDGIADIVTWDAGSVLAGNELGDEAILGDDDLLGGAHDSVYQAVIHIPRQKCEAIKFVIEDVASGDLNESYNLTHLELECALKGGVNKVQSEKTAGS